MDKEFVPYQEALELKELGFDELCLCFYNLKSQLVRYMNPDKDWNSLYSQTSKNSKITLPNTYTAPTFSQAFKWFREKHEVVGIVKFGTNDFTFNIYNSDGFGLLTKESLAFNGTYEEAELACLKKLIEIVKEKKNG